MSANPASNGITDEIYVLDYTESDKLQVFVAEAAGRFLLRYVFHDNSHRKRNGMQGRIMLHTEDRCTAERLTPMESAYGARHSGFPSSGQGH
jgi:hypothetical protein